MRGGRATRIEGSVKGRKGEPATGRVSEIARERKEEAEDRPEGRWTVGRRRRGCKVRGILSRSVNVYNDVRRWCPRQRVRRCVGATG